MGARIVFFLVATWFAPSVFSQQAGLTEPITETFSVAAGVVDVTPPVGTFLAGYGPDRRSSGTLDAVSARVLLVQAHTELLVLITLDSIGLTRPDVLRIQSGVDAILPGSHVVVSSTHTHAGPDVVGIWGSAMWRSGRDEGYIDGMIDTVVVKVQEVHGRLQPALSRVVSADVPLQWVENISEPGLLDQRLAVLQFTDMHGETIATLTNYACHPTVLGPDNTLVSADYVHGFYAGMANALPGEHLFLQGAIGGWVQPLQGDRSHELAVELGAGLAQQAITALQRAQANPPAELSFSSRTIDVPLENWGFRVLIWLGVLERELFDGAMRTSVATFNLGTARFVTHPGETSPAYSLATRQLLDTQHSFILGLSQDAMGYILKPEYFADDASFPSGEYLTSVSVGSEAGPILMSTITELVTATPTARTPTQPPTQ